MPFGLFGIGVRGFPSLLPRPVPPAGLPPLLLTAATTATAAPAIPVLPDLPPVVSGLTVAP